MVLDINHTCGHTFPVFLGQQIFRIENTLLIPLREITASSRTLNTLCACMTVFKNSLYKQDFAFYKYFYYYYCTMYSAYAIA